MLVNLMNLSPILNDSEGALIKGPVGSVIFSKYYGAGALTDEQIANAKKNSLLNLMSIAPVLSGSANLDSGTLIDGDVGSVDIHGNHSRYYGAGALTDEQIANAKKSLLNLMSIAPVLSGSANLNSGTLIDGDVGSVIIKGSHSKYYGAGALTDEQIAQAKKIMLI